MVQRLTHSLSSVLIIATLFITACSNTGNTQEDHIDTLNAEQELGKKLFQDASLSSDANQSCAHCHDSNSGFADPDVSKEAPVSEGSKAGEFGIRNAPTSAYAKFIPDFTKFISTTEGGTQSSYQGGQFLDGRALNLIEQAKAPFLNPVEMNNGEGLGGKTNVVTKVQAASYAEEFLSVYGSDAFDDIEIAYNNIATAIAAFEESAEMNPFSSKFDAVRAGKATFTESERRGFELFIDPEKGKCANCHTFAHPLRLAADSETLFTDFNYFNIGVPVNPDNPSAEVDIGLAANSAILPADVDAERGKFRTPTLRNVAITAPYMHNGVYATLEEVIRHYDITVANYLDAPGFVADISPETVPEVVENMAKELEVTLGLDNDNSDGMTDYEDLINFMNTLTDGYM